MKLIGFISATGLSLLLGTAVSAYGWQDQHEQQDKKERSAQQEEKHSKDAKPGKQGEHQAEREKPPAQRQERPARVEEKRAEPSRTVQKDKHNAQQENQHVRQQVRNKPVQRTREQQRVQRSAWQQHRSRNWQSEHRSWQQRGGYHGYRIPDDRFRGYFGPEHRFRIYGLPFMVASGYPRFQYEGYWISMVDPWPESWASNWYDTDDVYVSYADNGYYLFNRRYPTVAIAINVSN